MIYFFICIYFCTLLIAAVTIIKANSHKTAIQENEKDKSILSGYRNGLRVLDHLQDLEEDER